MLAAAEKAVHSPAGVSRESLRDLLIQNVANGEATSPRYGVAVCQSWVSSGYLSTA
jgi:hypothetical protein